MKNITIESALPSIIDSAKNELRGIAGKHRFILGVESGKVAFKLAGVKLKFDLANQILVAYTQLLTDKEKSYELFSSEILPLASLSDQQTNQELRERFIAFKQIEIPNFSRFKKEKFVDLIDFTEAEEEGFLILRTLLNQFRQISYHCSEDYFDTNTGLFLYSDSIEQDLVNKHTKFATTDQASRFISLSFVVMGLNDLFETNGPIAHADSATQRQSLESYLLSLADDLMFTKDGLSIDSNKLKKAMGFDSALASIRIRPALKPLEVQAEEVPDNPHAYKKLQTVTIEGEPLSEEYQQALKDNFLTD